MALRVKELCKLRGMTIKDIAEKMGMDASNLSGSLKGNPKLSTLQDVARALGVEVYDLFEHRNDGGINGFVEVNEEVYRIKKVEDLFEITAKVDVLSTPRQYNNIQTMREDVGAFIRECVYSGSENAIIGRILNVEIFALVYHEGLFHLASQQGSVRTFDIMNYGCNDNYDLDSDEGIIAGILNDIESVFDAE